MNGNQGGAGGEAIDFSAELAAFDADYAKAPADTGDGRVADGKYQVRVMDATLARASTSGAPMLKMKLKVEGPTSIGRYIWRNSLIQAEKLEYLKRDLSRLGIQIGKLSELPARLPEVKGILLEITAKTSGEFQNYYIDKRLAETGGPVAGGSEFGGGFGGGFGGQRAAAPPATAGGFGRPTDTPIEDVPF